MNVLLDECVPAPLRKLLTQHACRTVQQCGWAGISNGALITKAELEKFDLFPTADQNLSYQQNLKNRMIAILLLSTNKWRPIKAAMPQILAAIESMQPGEFREIAVPQLPA